MTDDRTVIHRRDLPAEVVKARAEFTEADQQNADTLAPAVRAHLEAVDGSLAMMQRHHAAFVNTTDFDPQGKTRPAALWLLSGRVLALGRALVVLLGAGYTTEADPTARALDEAVRVLQLLLDSDDERSLKDWNRGSWWNPKKLLTAEHARETRMSARLRELGIEPPAPTAELNDDEYAIASKHAHAQRRPILETWRPALRRMLTGPEAPATQRAAWVGFGTEWALGAIVVLGTAMTALQPPERRAQFHSEIVEPTLASFARLRKAVPLDPGTLGFEEARS